MEPAEYSSYYYKTIDFDYMHNFKQIVEHVQQSIEKYQQILDFYKQKTLERSLPGWINPKYLEEFTLEDLLYKPHDLKFENIMSNWYYCYNSRDLFDPDSLNITRIWYSLITYFIKTNQFKKYKVMVNAISFCDRDIANWSELLNIISWLLPENDRFFLFTLNRFWLSGGYEDISNPSKINSGVLNMFEGDLGKFLKDIITLRCDYSVSHYYGENGDVYIPNIYDMTWLLREKKYYDTIEDNSWDDFDNELKETYDVIEKYINTSNF